MKTDEPSGEPEPPITRFVKSLSIGGGPVTAVVIRLIFDRLRLDSV